MQINGTITSLAPTPEVGYQSQNGYIYTFNMGVQSPQGAYFGEIGSKSQIYPLQVGQPIIVEVKETPQGTKFKKINPKYANQAPQQAPQQASPQQPQAAQQGHAPVKERDFDREAHGKCFTVIFCARVQSGKEPIVILSDPAEMTAIADAATACMNSYDYRSDAPRTIGGQIGQSAHMTEPDDHQNLSNDDIPF